MREINFDVIAVVGNGKKKTVSHCVLFGEGYFHSFSLLTVTHVLEFLHELY